MLFEIEFMLDDGFLTNFVFTFFKIYLQVFFWFFQLTGVEVTTCIFVFVKHASQVIK